MKINRLDFTMLKTTALLLCMAAPAAASTITLDDGDLGVSWVEGVGFRAVDGLDVYGGGKFDCPVKAVWKDGAEDRVVVDRECETPDLFASSIVAEDIFGVADLTGDTWTFLTGTATPPEVTPTTPGVVPTGLFPCCDTTEIVTVVEPPVVTPSPVPLASTWFYLLVALSFMAGFASYSRRKA